MNRTWRRLGALWPGVVLALSVLLLAACVKVEDIAYETTCDHDELAQLAGGTLVILPYEYAPDLLMSDTFPEEVALAIGDEQKQGLIEQLGATFTLIDPATDDADISGDLPAVDDPEAIAEFLSANGADGAVLVQNSYGYSMQQSILEQIVDQFIEQAAGDETAEMIQAFGENPTVINSYYFASDTTLLNADGEPVWNFFGKAVMMPRPFSGTVGEEAESFLRSVMALNPTERELVRYMNPILEQYNEYLAWMIQADLDESEDLSYYTGFPGAEEEKRTIAVFPASDDSHAPGVRTEEEMAQAEAAQANNLWTRARAGRWNTFWQWPEAWAAAKLLGICFLAAGICGYIYDKAGEDSLLGQAFGLLGLAASIGFLIALYQLLKAVF